MSEESAIFEARRILRIGLADVCPDDAAAIERINYLHGLDPLQREAVVAVAALVRRFDEEPS